ncbi:proline-rich protein 2-like [Harmonia axyridis]|uniref:proline-rich protein 2-like n=1 Tax=Harmonia axyridis TaxID=115357 RepID=UPI001E277693|nr:proline-rich protein 2-like [Harmonia axyridis]
MLRSIIIICCGYHLAAAAAVPASDNGYHGLNLDDYSLLKSQLAPLYTEPIFKGYPQPLYLSPLPKETFLPAPIYAPAASIFKVPAPIYTAPVLKEAAPAEAAVPVVKAVAPVVKAVAPATSYASVTKYHISHGPAKKVVVPVAPVVKEISYDNLYGYH